MPIPSLSGGGGISGGGSLRKGNWDPSTNTPTLTSGAYSGDIGDWYFVEKDGTQSIDGVSSWVKGDKIVWNGSKWEKEEPVESANSITKQELQNGVMAKSYSGTVPSELDMRIVKTNNGMQMQRYEQGKWVNKGAVEDSFHGDDFYSSGHIGGLFFTNEDGHVTELIRTADKADDTQAAISVGDERRELFLIGDGITCVEPTVKETIGQSLHDKTAIATGHIELVSGKIPLGGLIESFEVYTDGVSRYRFEVKDITDDAILYENVTEVNFDEAGAGDVLAAGIQTIKPHKAVRVLSNHDVTITISYDGDVNFHGTGTFSPYFRYVIQHVKFETNATQEWVNSTFDGTTQSFSHELAIKAKNNTGTPIEARSYVFLEPTKDNSFEVKPITNNTGYKGELFGYVKDRLVTEGNVLLICSIETGVTGVSEGVSAYIGMDSLGNVEITKDNIGYNVFMGRCGVFGEQNDIGEYYATFNAFEVQATKLIAMNQEKDFELFEPTGPIALPKNVPYMVYRVNMGGTGETIDQLLPDPSLIMPGTTLHIENVSTSYTNKVALTVENGKLIDNSASLNINGENSRAILISTKDKWQVFLNFDARSNNPSNAKVTALEAEVNRIKAEISQTVQGTIYTYRGKKLPVDLTSNHKAYYLLFHGFKGSSFTLDLPTFAVNDVVFHLDNTDFNTSQVLNAPQGFTVDGKTSITVKPESMCFLVSEIGSKNWFVVYNNYAPDTITSLIKDIKAKIGSELNTIDEIQAQLKDRLHTFNQIQTQFSNELHTYDEIETEMTTRGFQKDGVTQLNLQVDDGTNNVGSVNFIQFAGAEVTPSPDTSGKVLVDTFTNFNLMSDPMYGGKANSVLVEDPLNVYDDPDKQATVRLSIQHDYFEKAKPPGYLAYLQESEEVLGRVKEGEAGVRQSTIWFDDVIVGGNSAFIEIDKPNKALGVQDYTDDDPNVTGGIPTLLVLRVAMKGTAPSDGFVEILLKKTDEGTPTQDGGYILNANGQPIGVRRHYKTGDKLGHLEAAGIYMAKGLTKFQCIVEHDFVDDGVLIEDRTEGASGVLIQALGNDYATGDALLQFENDTMQNIEMTKHYNGDDIFNIKWALSYDRPYVDITAGTGQTSVDGMHFYNNTNLKAGVANDTLTINDNGSDLAYFSLGQIFSAEKTYMLRNKDIDVKLTLQDKQNAYRVYMVKWTGKPDAYTKKIIDRYDADAGAITEANWVLSGNVFISEDAVSGEHDFAGTLTVPSDAVNFAVVIVPSVQELPTSLQMKGFEINVSDPFTGWVLESPELVGEKHLEFSEKHKELRCDVAGHTFIRYTLNNVPAGMPMPIGVLGKGNADIEVDHTINQVSGTSLPQFEGAIKFLTDGLATINTELYVHSEKLHSVLATTKFWYSKVSADGNTFTKIPESEYVVEVRGQTKAINKMPKFTINVKANDRIALFGTSDRADGAFIDQNAGNPTPMLKTTIDFDEITEQEADLLDKITLLDQEIVITEAAQQAGWYIELDYDPDTGQPSLKPKQR